MYTVILFYTQVSCCRVEQSLAHLLQLLSHTRHDFLSYVKLCKHLDSYPQIRSNLMKQLFIFIPSLRQFIF